MKATLAVLALAGLIFANTSCDKHSWESTQGLHEGMHKAHGDEHHGEAKHDDHAKPAAHGEAKHEEPKKDEHAKPAAH